MKPQPNPKTQERVDSTDLAALAKLKADTAEITLAHWHAMVTNAGVRDVRFELDHDGITIVLKGSRERRTVESTTLCPKGQPFPLYAMLALKSFEQGVSPATGSAGSNVESVALQAIADAVAEPEPVEDVPPMHVEDVVDIAAETLPEPCQHESVSRHFGEDGRGQYVYWKCDRCGLIMPAMHAGDVVDIAADAFTGTEEPVDPAALEGQTVLDAMPPEMRKAAKAKAIAKRARPVDIHKPPPAGAGERRPLSLPLCKVCKTQPVYNPSAEFCGAECARRHFMDHAKRTTKGSR